MTLDSFSSMHLGGLFQLSTTTLESTFIMSIAVTTVFTIGHKIHTISKRVSDQFFRWRQLLYAYRLLRA